MTKAEEYIKSVSTVRDAIDILDGYAITFKFSDNKIIFMDDNSFLTTKWYGDKKVTLTTKGLSKTIFDKDI